ncbi:malectin domain-containing carbohydrate-binding protein [Nocardioides sp. YIM 152588]|uniref:malectin domain-containing carbohydrate-binding protein n=1 Tax=Nocardioides sp. YIM 152588 TaxID=3158259 RepID=UPI0032E3C201
MHVRSSRRAVATGITAALALVGLAATPGQAFNADHGDGLVAEMPQLGTPHVMDGSVQAIIQVGSRIIATGTFTSVSPSGTYADTSDDLVRNGIFAFDAATGVIDPDYDPNLGNGTGNSLATDGTNVFVGGSFGMVGGEKKYKRVVKLNPSGSAMAQFKVTPKSVVNEVGYHDGRLFVGGGFPTLKSRKVVYEIGHLAELDPVRGTPLTSFDLPFTGVYNPSGSNPGKTNVKRFDVSPDGTRLAVIGNFGAVAGQTRSQVAVIDLSGATATLAPFFTNRFDRSHSVCAQAFDTFTRDLDFSPDGSYFVVSTTGAFAGGANNNTLCDTVSRWETGQTGNDPTWVTYTGGDTTYGVAVTGSAVYVGGHMRWENNPFQGDQAGPGAIPREGIAALHPVNGMPFAWNPGRDRGVGAQALYATADGLWVGSDTTLFNNQRRGRIAFLPLAGGATSPSVTTATLPNDLFGATYAEAPTNVLARINAGDAFGTTSSTDGGPSWSGHFGLVSGGLSGFYSSSVDMSGVPSSTPTAVFQRERYGDQDWNLNIPSGTPITVRLYFANQSSSSSSVGDRKFDVTVDGALVLDDFDVVEAAGGHRVAVMASYSTVSDGQVDIDLDGVVGSAFIDAIEILDSSQAGAAGAELQRRPVDATGAPTGPAATVDDVEDWSGVRGGFLLNGDLYYGRTDNNLYRRSFDAATGALGPATQVDLHDDPDNGNRIPFAISSMTGMFFDPETFRIYYTVSGDSRLYYRYFMPRGADTPNPDDTAATEYVGAQTFTADAGGVSFSSAAGLTLAGGRILYGSSDGSLRSVPFSGGRVTGPATVVSGDGTWRFRALFAGEG